MDSWDREFAGDADVDGDATNVHRAGQPVTDYEEPVTESEGPVTESEGPVIDIVEIDAVEEELADVERALARLDEGVYGTCEVCGASLTDPELAAAPATRFCRAHLPMTLA